MSDKIALYQRGIDKMAASIEGMLPPGVDPKRFIQIAKSTLNDNPWILEKDPKSFKSACEAAAKDGLVPDGKEAAFVPFKGKVSYMPMVHGVIKKVVSSPQIRGFFSDVRYEKDGFEYWTDENGKHVKHRPYLDGPRGEFMGVFAVAVTTDGYVYADYMNKEEVEKVRSKSQNPNKGPWADWYDQMAQKSVIHRIAKKLPTTSEVLRVIDEDNKFYNLTEAQPEPPRLERAKDANKPNRLMAAIEAESEPVAAHDGPPPPDDDDYPEPGSFEPEGDFKDIEGDII